LGTNDFTPLNWLLRDEITGSHFRRQRRKVYGMYVRALELALTTIYRERMMAVGGPWDFESLTAKKGQADKAIRQLRWCSVLHFFRLPGRYIASERAYVAAMRCLQSVVSIADYRR
jgi:hypothetical protein